MPPKRILTIVAPLVRLGQCVPPPFSWADGFFFWAAANHSSVNDDDDRVNLLAKSPLTLMPPDPILSAKLAQFAGPFGSHQLSCYFLPKFRAVPNPHHVPICGY